MRFPPALPSECSLTLAPFRADTIPYLRSKSAVTRELFNVVAELLPSLPTMRLAKHLHCSWPS